MNCAYIKRNYPFYLLVMVVLVFGSKINAQTFISPQFNVSIVGSGYGVPMGLTFNKDGSKMFSWEKGGIVHVSNWNNTTKTYDLQSTQVLNISDEVGNWGDYGLLGFALDPNYDVNGYIYLMYVVDRYYLLNYGSPSYNPNLNSYNNATIGRITRFTTYINGSSQLVVDTASRRILLGESITTGIPITHDSHGVGTLMFADDSTLLASVGDGASYDGIDTGSNAGTYYAQALADGIIRPEENVGAYRSQMINSFNGKILRLDRTTGNGVPSNPFYDAGNPRSPKSRVWALGFRNPFRFVRKPGSGSTNPAAADMGELYVGDVGWNKYEEFSVISEPAMNAGWPVYEGYKPTELYPTTIKNRDEPNPLYGTGGCTQQYFTFNNLIKQPTADNNRFLPNPCNPAVDIVYGPSNRFIHQRPAMSWIHACCGFSTNVSVFNGNIADTAEIGTPASGVTGTPFNGNCAAGACWYTGTRYGTQYNGTYFLADYVGAWIKNISFPAVNQISKVEDFGSNVGSLICMAQSPMDSLIYMVNYLNNTVIRLNFGGNRSPVAILNSDKTYGPSPLAVSFNGSSSYDPDGNPITYSWDFGDGTTSTSSNPSHTFGISGNTTPVSFTVTLTVTDNLGASSSTTKIISINNTPPVVLITSPPNNTFYSTGPDTTYQLTANVTDDQSGSSLKYAWQTVLRHNTHEHRDAIDTIKITSATIARVGCTGDVYYYFITLSVTDPYGLVGMDSVKIFPSCSGFPTVNIATQPVSQSICSNQPVTFSSTTADQPFPSIVWQQSADNGNNWTTIQGAKSTNLVVIPSPSDNGKLFRAAWTNSGGTIYSGNALLTVASAPAAPTGNAIQYFCDSGKVSGLVASGTAIKWYYDSVTSTALPLTDNLISGHSYFATQTVNGCESTVRLKVKAIITSYTSATLDGSGSSGTITSYSWSTISGPNSPTIANPGSVITTVSNLVPGNYVFQLSLNGGTSTSRMSLKVAPPDSPSVADAGYDRTIALPTSSINLNGTGSTGKITNYAWSLVSGPNTPAFITPNQVTTSVTGLIQGTYAFQLSITDNASNVKKDTVQITVNAASPAASSPVINTVNTNSSTTSSCTNSLTSVPAGALLVLTIAQADDQGTAANATVTSTPSLTWTKRADAGAIGSGNAEIYTAVFSAGGNISVTTNFGVNGMTTVVYVITNYNTSFAGNSAVANSQAAPGVTINTTLVNSLIVAATSDWSAINGSTRVYRDAATESFYQFRNGYYTAYHYRKQATTQGSYTEGLTTPNNMVAGTVLFEIKGSSNIPPLSDAGANVVITIPGPPTGPASQNFCYGGTIANLTASGSSIKWYNSPSGGTTYQFTDSLVNGNHYYASQTVGGCEVAQRLDVTATITSPATPVITVADNCDSSFTLSTTAGGTLLWSTGAGTISIRADTAGTYKVTRTINGCTSTPGSVSVTPSLLKISAIATQPLCIGETGSVVLNATGGAGGYVFNSTPTSGLVAGSYLYTVTDANGCTKDTNVQIGVIVAIWTGAVNSDWHNPANWNTGKVPDSTTHVIIPVTANDCIISNGDAAAASVQTKTGAAYRVVNNHTITITGKCAMLPSLN